MTLSSPLAPDPTRPIGLVLSGGGARGAFQVGVWEILSTDPRGIQGKPDVISGTSAGALNGAFIAAGLSPEQMLSFWLSLADHPPVIANENFFRSAISALQRQLLREPLRGPLRRIRELRIASKILRNHRWYRSDGLLSMLLEYLLTARFDSVSQILDGIDTSYLFDTQPLRERLRQWLGSNTLKQSEVKLAINAVDVATGGIVRLVNHQPKQQNPSTSKNYRYVPEFTLDMLISSASIPLLFNPVRVKNMTLWDGGLLVNTPLAPTVTLGAQRIVPVLVTVQDGVTVPTDQPLPNFGTAVERLANSFLENAYNVDRKLLLERNLLAERLPDMNMVSVDLFRALRPSSGQLFNAGSYLYFERSAMLAMYESGKLAARRWLDQGPRIDSRELSA